MLQFFDAHVPQELPEDAPELPEPVLLKLNEEISFDTSEELHSGQFIEIALDLIIFKSSGSRLLFSSSIG